MASSVLQNLEQVRAVPGNDVCADCGAESLYFYIVFFTFLYPVVQN